MKSCFVCSRRFQTNSSLFYHLNEENHFITDPRKGRHRQRDNYRIKRRQSPDYSGRQRRLSPDCRRSSSSDSDSAYETVTKHKKVRSTSNKGMNNRFSNGKNGHSSRESSPPRFISSFVSPDRMDITPAAKDDDRCSVLIECKRSDALSDNLRKYDPAFDTQNVVEPRVPPETPSTSADASADKLKKQVPKASSKNSSTEDHRKEEKAPSDATNSTSLKDKSSGLKVDDSDMRSKSEESVSIDVTNPKQPAKMGIYEKCCPEEGNQPSIDGEKITNSRKIESSTIRTSAEEANKDSVNDQSVIGLESFSAATSGTQTSKFSQLREYIKKQRANTVPEVLKPSSTFLGSFVPFQENEGGLKGSVVQMLHGNESSKTKPCETKEVCIGIANGTLACGGKKQTEKSHVAFKLSSHKTSKLNNNPMDPRPENESLSNEKSLIIEPCVTPQKHAENIHKASKVACNVKEETTEGSFVSKISFLETPTVNDKSIDSKYGCVPRSADVSLAVKAITPLPMETIPLLFPQLKNQEKTKLIESSEESRKKNTSQPQTHFPKPLKFLGNVQKMSRDSKRVVAETVPLNNSTLNSAGNTNLARDDISNRIKEADCSSSRCISRSSSVSLSLLCTNDLQTPNDDSNDSSNFIDSATKSLDKAIVPEQIAKFDEVANLQVTHLPSIGSYDDFCSLLPSNEEPASKSNSVITETTSNAVTKSQFPEKKSASSECDEVCISPIAMQLPAIRSYDDPVHDVSVQYRTSNEVLTRETDMRQGIFPAKRSRNRSEPSSEKHQLSNLDSKDRNIDTLWEPNTRPKSAGDWTAVPNSVSPLSAKRFITLYSTTLRIGPLSKLVTEENLYDTFSPFGEIISIDVIPPRSCAYIVMGRRQDAYEALTQLSGYKLQGTVIQLAWAPGRGLKGKDLKSHWKMEQGVSYIPLDRIVSAKQLKELEEGGYLDEETIPQQFKGLNQVAMAGKGLDKQTVTKSLYLRRRDLDSKITATVDSVKATVGQTSCSDELPFDELGNPLSLTNEGPSKVPVEEFKNVSEGLLLALDQFKNSSHVELESVSDGSVSNLPEKTQNDPFLCLEKDDSHDCGAEIRILGTFGCEEREKLKDEINQESQKCLSPKRDSSESGVFKIQEFSSSNSESSSQPTPPRRSPSPRVANVHIKEASTAVKNTTEKELNKNLPSRLKSKDDSPSASASSVENITRRVDVTEIREVETSKTVESTVGREVLPEITHANTSKTPKTESLIQSSDGSNFPRENATNRFGGSVDTKKAEKSTTAKITVAKEDNRKPPGQLKTQKNLSSESAFSVGSTAHRASVVESRELDKSKTTKSAIEQELLSEVTHETEISSKIPKLGSLKSESSVTSQIAFKSDTDNLSLPQPSSKSDLQRENTTHRIDEVERKNVEKSTTAKNIVENEVVTYSETNSKELLATSDQAEDQESTSASEMIPFQCLSEALRQKEIKSVMESGDDVLNEKTGDKQKLIKERLYENAGFKVTKKFIPFQSYPPMPKTRIAHVPKVPLPLDKKCSAPSTPPQKCMNSSEKPPLIHKAHQFCPKENAIPLASANIKKESTLKPKHVIAEKAARKKPLYHSSSTSSAKVTEERTTSDSTPEENAPLVPANLPSPSNSDPKENGECATPQSKEINKFVESSSSPRDISYSRLNAFKCGNKSKTQHGLSRNLETSNEDTNIKKVVKPQYCKLGSDNVKKTNPKLAFITEPTSTSEDAVAASKSEIGSKKTGNKGGDKLEPDQVKKTTPKPCTSSGPVSTSEYPYATVKQEILCKKSGSKSSEEERKDKPRESVLKEKQASKSNVEEKTTKSKLSAESSSEDSDEIFFQYNRKSLVPGKKRKNSKKDLESRKRRREKTKRSSETSDKADRKIKSEIPSDDSTCDSTLSKDSEHSRRGSLGSGGGPSILKGTSAKPHIKYYPQAWNDPFCRKCQSMEFELLNTSTCADIYYLKCRSCNIHIVVDMSNEPL